MAKDPRQRYANGGEFADAVAAVRAGRRPPARQQHGHQHHQPHTAAHRGNPGHRHGPATSAPYSHVDVHLHRSNYAAPRPPQRPEHSRQHLDHRAKVLAALAGSCCSSPLGVVGFWACQRRFGIRGDPKTRRRRSPRPPRTPRPPRPPRTKNPPAPTTSRPPRRPRRHPAHARPRPTPPRNPTGETTTTGATTTQDTATEDPGNGARAPGPGNPGTPTPPPKTRATGARAPGTPVWETMEPGTPFPKDRATAGG